MECCQAVDVRYIEGANLISWNASNIRLSGCCLSGLKVKVRKLKDHATVVKLSKRECQVRGFYF